MEERIQFTTPESVHITFEIAGIGSRFVALLLDTLIQGILFLILAISFIAAGVTFEGVFNGILSWYTTLVILMSFLILIGYFIIFEMLLKGRTPGKAAMKIRVIRRNGQQVSFLQSCLRNIFRLADFFPGFYGIGLIIMFISPDARRIGDYLGGTIVVKEYAGRIPFSFDEMNKRKEIPLNIYPLQREEYRLLKDFLNRRKELLPAKREALEDQLARKYWEKFHIPEEEQREPVDFLERLLDMNG